jgi:hypothetical protein
MKYRIFWAIIFFISLSDSYSSAKNIRVPGDSKTIQEGIDAAIDDDTVLVAPGTYSGSGNREIDFKGKAIVLTSENGPEETVIEGKINFII